MFKFKLKNYLLSGVFIAISILIAFLLEMPINVVVQSTIMLICAMFAIFMLYYLLSLKIIFVRNSYFRNKYINTIRSSYKNVIKYFLVELLFFFASIIFNSMYIQYIFVCCGIIYVVFLLILFDIIAETEIKLNEELIK